MRMSDWSSDVCSAELPLGQRPARSGQRPDLGFLDRAFAAEQAALPARALIVEPGGGGEHRLGDRGDARPVGSERIERATRRQRLELALVEQPRIDAPREIAERGEWAVRAAFGDEFLPRPLAHALERGERVAHRITILMRLDRETDRKSVV